MWAMLDRAGIGRPMLILVAGFVNLAGATLCVYVAKTRFAAHAPHWLARALAATGFLFGTVACIAAITHTGIFSSHSAEMTRQDLAAIALFAVAAVLVGIATLQRRIDVFPMALIAASFIAISTAWIIASIRFKDLGAFFVIATWLIVTSTAAGFLLMRWVREWRK
jgi:hypothetical protein